MRFIVSTLLIILFLTGCGIPRYSVTVTNINSIGKFSNIKFQNKIAKSLYPQGMDDIYEIYGSILSVGEEIDSGDWNGIFTSTMYYNALIYGKQMKFKYITFTYPYSMLFLNKLETYEEFCKTTIGNRAYSDRMKRTYKNFNYEEEPGSGDLVRSRISRIEVKYHKEKPYDVLSYNIEEVLEHLKTKYRYENVKTFALELGIKKNQEPLNYNNESADLTKIPVYVHN